MSSRRTESDIKRDVVHEVKMAHGYARRIEDQFSVGFPDMVVILCGGPVCFAEFKRFDGNLFSPSPRQYVELQRIQNASEKAVALVVGWKSGVFYIANPQPVVDIRTAKPLSVGEKFVSTLEDFLR